MSRRAWIPSNWATAPETPSAGPSSSSAAPSMILEEPDGASPTHKPRQRLMSLPLNSLASQLEKLSIDGSQKDASPKKTGIRGLLRRASVSMKAKRTRRHSHTSEMEDRPGSASSPWKMLRQAASFNRNLRDPMFESEGLVGFGDMIDSSSAGYGLAPLDSCDPTSAPVPGHGSAPPVIPRGSGGAAARATAAAQNQQYNGIYQLIPHLSEEDGQADRESGIGIAVSTTPEPAQTAEQEDSISQVDFVKDLPTELAIMILAHLDQYSLARTAYVSKAWAEVTASQHVWRETFLRDKTRTYATSTPIRPGTCLGIPDMKQDIDWKGLYKVRRQLEQNWKSGDAESVYLNGHLDSIYCLQFDEHKIITGSRDKTIRVWNLKTHTCSLVIGPKHVVTAATLMNGNDGKPMHYATSDGSTTDGARHAQCIPDVVHFDMRHNASILCLQYDKDILVTGSSDSTCIIYDIKNGYKPIRRLEHHVAAVLDLAFDDRYVVTCSKDCTICVWDRKTGIMLKQLRGHSGPVNAVQMRGNTIVSCSGDFKVKLWNIETGKCIREFTGHTKGLACSQYSEDSKYIASAGNDKMIHIWDANTGECLHKISAHESLVRSLHIDSVSGRLISGSYDQDVKVFDMETGRLLLDFPKWHTSWVLGAKSDYRRIISTGQEPKVLILDFGAKVKGIEGLESSPR